jgi:hypothetical protein
MVIPETVNDHEKGGPFPEIPPRKVSGSTTVTVSPGVNGAAGVQTAVLPSSEITLPAVWGPLADPVIKAPP